MPNLLCPLPCPEMPPQRKRLSPFALRATNHMVARSASQCMQLAPPGARVSLPFVLDGFGFCNDGDAADAAGCCFGGLAAFGFAAGFFEPEGGGWGGASSVRVEGFGVRVDLRAGASPIAVESAPTSGDKR